MPDIASTKTTPINIIHANQVGFFPKGRKMAVLLSGSTRPVTWLLHEVSGQIVLQGQTTPRGYDLASGDPVHWIDFTAWDTPGASFYLSAGRRRSASFAISPHIYTQLKRDALAYFYLNRSGTPIEARYTPGLQWARPAGHLSDSLVTGYVGPDRTGMMCPGTAYSLDAAGGWYDAGDYGKYVVNGGIAVWTLQNYYERNPEVFPDGSLKIPENHNNRPDILDEARWEMEWLIKMKVPAGQPLAGMVHNKLHGRKWDPMPSLPPSHTHEKAQDGGRVLLPPSTAATLNLAAAAAQAARLWKSFDRPFADRCLTVAESAWQAAALHPDLIAPAFSLGGGDYGDQDLEDEFYWAAAELYTTTGKDIYCASLLSSPYWAKAAPLAWNATAPLGTLTLVLVPNDLPEEKVEECRQSLIATAEDYLARIEQEGYRVPVASPDYAWGSNSEILNRLLITCVVHQLTGERKYLLAAVDGLDYLLGRNPLGISYIAGYGARPIAHPHHRFWANQPAQGFPPPPPGTLSGGPNAHPSDPAAAPLDGQPPARCFIDQLESYSTNEVAINWNAPLAWVAGYLDEQGQKILT